MSNSLRILSYNIHKGFSPSGRRFVLDELRSAIRTLDVDVVFLQEVLGNHDRHAKNIPDWPLESQFEYLADEVWPHFAYGKNAVYRAGHHGNAILSRFPIRSAQNVDISTSNIERRGILYALIEDPLNMQSLHCFNVHLNVSHRSRLRQVQRLCDFINDTAAADAPFVLAGDFNDWPQRLSRFLESHAHASEVFKHLHGRYAATYPSKYPLLKLDRVYVRGLKALEAKVLSGEPWSKLSDHNPLVAMLLRGS